jgi:hypothetical protein
MVWGREAESGQSRGYQVADMCPHIRGNTIRTNVSRPSFTHPSRSVSHRIRSECRSTQCIQLCCASPLMSGSSQISG